MSNKNKYGEIFTPRFLTEEMLDLLPSDCWNNPEYKWIDPACGSGIFCYIVAERLLNGFQRSNHWNPGLTEIIPDINKRKEIISNNIYGIDIQGKNIWISRKLIEELLDNTQNIQRNFVKFDTLTYNFKFKFNIVIGNPPYQKDRLNNSNSKAQNLYVNFVNLSYNISNKYLLFITPSRWFDQNGLEAFRKNMLYNYGLKILNHFENPEFFKNTDIKGGVSYFLIEKEYNGPIKNNFCNQDIIENKEEMLITRNSITINILNKLKNYNNIQYRIKSKGYYKIKSNDSRLESEYKNGYLKCYVSIYKNNIKYIDKNEIDKKYLQNWKILLRSADGLSRDCPDYYIIASPNEICSESYTPILFNTKKECNNFISWFKTNLFRYLVSIKKNTHYIGKDIFEYIPDLNYNQEWNNEKVNKYFNLSEEEVKYINENQPIIGYSKLKRGFC